MAGFRVLTLCLLSAVALSGCMHRPGPVATVPAHGDLDRLAYGSPAAPPPAYAARPADSGGAISALRNSFASTARQATRRSDHEGVPVSEVIPGDQEEPERTPAESRAATTHPRICPPSPCSTSTGCTRRRRPRRSTRWGRVVVGSWARGGRATAPLRRALLAKGTGTVRPPCCPPPNSTPPARRRHHHRGRAPRQHR